MHRRALIYRRAGWRRTRARGPSQTSLQWCVPTRTTPTGMAGCRGVGSARLDGVEWLLLTLPRRRRGGGALYRSRGLWKRQSRLWRSRDRGHIRPRAWTSAVPARRNLSRFAACKTYARVAATRRRGRRWRRPCASSRDGMSSAPTTPCPVTNSYQRSDGRTGCTYLSRQVAARARVPAGRHCQLLRRGAFDV